MSGDEEEEELVWGWTLTAEGISAYFVAFLSLTAVTLFLSKFLHQYPRLGNVLPEAGLQIIVGMLAGWFIDSTAHFDTEDDLQKNYDDDYYVNNPVLDTLLNFSPTVFFVALLPPIVFNSGYHLKRTLFFRHLSAITLYAVVGTTVSTILIGLMMYCVVSMGLADANFNPSFAELLTFGAVISAVDPVSTLAVFQQKRVDPQLFYLVFGESAVNDAVSLLLFNTLSKFVGSHDSIAQFAAKISLISVDFAFLFICSMLLGVTCGVFLALFFKNVNFRNTRLLELSLYVIVAYFPFFVAEMAGISGVVTILFTGITANRYAIYNITPLTATEADVIFRVLAHLAETAIFLNLGLSVFEQHGEKFKIIFALWAFAACLISRAAHVYPITFLYNKAVIIAAEKDLKTIEQHPSKDFSKDFVGLRPVSSIEETPKPMTQGPYNPEIYTIKTSTAHMLWYSGLRGAVAYACAETFPDANGNRQAFISITMCIVLLTVFLQGSTTSAALTAFKVDVDVDEEKYMREKMETTFSRFQHFENEYILPFLLRDLNKNACQYEKQELLSEFFSDINLNLDIKQMLKPHQSKHDQSDVELNELPSNRYKRADDVEMNPEIPKRNKTMHNRKLNRTRTSMYDFGNKYTI
mmetsp:Transcript_370/g.864  ORF Transcript_370/g.864 Transcript_370/m.864 type:complete len:637 (-) Transcript_370:326-2236(-)|eukprot:CAMPEP_0194342316 /NCGR_PEP_ID=MMETSP0171-20130528/92434_1 /TAXON_ID=218684 /ORGANISM="Corethron pennatum, Strain L29A3" /LENGTH=636 /DNA_ID=CAMNT_0039107989 /DNA_START=150 /DNA_END=2060 /DNA_ORIENTATION=-